MCRVFIKNMLEERTPIKDSVFYAERWVREEELSKRPPPSAPQLNLCIPGLGPGCSSPPPLPGAASPRRAVGERAPLRGYAAPWAASLFLPSIADLNAVNSPSSRNFLL